MAALAAGKHYSCYCWFSPSCASRNRLRSELRSERLDMSANRTGWNIRVKFSVIFQWLLQHGEGGGELLLVSIVVWCGGCNPKTSRLIILKWVRNLKHNCKRGRGRKYFVSEYNSGNLTKCFKTLLHWINNEEESCPHVRAFLIFSFPGIWSSTEAAQLSPWAATTRTTAMPTSSPPSSSWTTWRSCWRNRWRSTNPLNR